MKNLLNRIVLDPEIMVGKPTIRGTRITVQHILGLLARNFSPEAIIEEYPRVTREDIQACLLFAQNALEDFEFVPLITGA